MTARVTTNLDELLLLRAEARGFSLSTRQPVTSLLSGRHASRLRGRGLDFEELRQYHAGDDVRNIDWKATARLKRPQVRVYTEERERPVLMLVDQRQPMFFGSRRVMKSVAAAEVASLGAWRTLDAGDRVGALVFNEREVAHVRPKRSQNAVLRLLHEVVRMNQELAGDNPAEGSVTLNQVLEMAVQTAHHDYLVVLISDLDGADEQTRRLTTQLAAHNDLLVVAVYDPLGASLTGASNMTATDGQQVWQIPAGEEFPVRFREAFQRRLDHWRGVFRDLKIPLLPISSATPPAAQVRSLLGYQHPTT